MKLESKIETDSCSGGLCAVMAVESHGDDALVRNLDPSRPAAARGTLFNDYS